jgi:protein SCO1/2
VAITFDPLRDTPEVLKEYVRHFDKDFIGVSGEQTQINQLIKPLYF